ncbi:MAG: hypothetical protein WCP19_08895 [Chloroflexota bacterium]
MTNNEWVTLIELFDRLEAEIFKEAIEAQGIPCELFQEGISHYLYPVSGPLGKIDVCVPSARMKDASEWLEAYNKDELADTNPDENIEVN